MTSASQRKRGERQAPREVGHLALGARAQPALAGYPVPQRPCRSRLWKRPASSPNFFSGERVSSRSLEGHVPMKGRGSVYG